MSHPQNLFRQKNVKAASSPDQLNDYIRVSRPGLWLLLIAVFLLLVGGLVWGFLGTLSSTVDMLLVVENGRATGYVLVEDDAQLAAGMEVRARDSRGSIVSTASAPVEVNESFSAYLGYVNGLSKGSWVLPVVVDIKLPNDVYKAEVLTESISPIEFVFN